MCAITAAASGCAAPVLIITLRRETVQLVLVAACGLYGCSRCFLLLL
jgi:hypothetical protein